MKTCFVVQGFGRKTDYRDGRVLDLDASYAIIKGAVEAAGLKCIRADEIQHSGTIDLPMYRWLLDADLVIADLSTYNVNAVFELGVRYGLRPRATILVAEEQFQNPFDVSHISMRRYKHLGEDIGAREAKRFGDDLKAAIEAIVGGNDVDSPIYTFLPQLQPPDEAALAAARAAPGAVPGGVTAGGDGDDMSTKQLLDLAQQRIDASDFGTARALLDEVRKRRPNDSFVIQRLALATYKSKQPDAERALLEAREVLAPLKPESCNNPETLGLWGAIHKRLWELHPSPELLDASITAYGRGFALKQDHYNGVNFAFLLDLRAREALKAGQRDDAITDHTLAARIRREVARYAQAYLDTLPADMSAERFWVVASLWEAAVGTGDDAAVQRWEAALRGMNAADWMHETRLSQGAKLRALLDDYARPGV